MIGHNHNHNITAMPVNPSNTTKEDIRFDGSSLKEHLDAGEYSYVFLVQVSQGTGMGEKDSEGDPTRMLKRGGTSPRSHPRSAPKILC